MLPANWTLVPITGRYVGRDGVPVRGGLIFQSPQVVVVDGVQIVPRQLRVELDDDGNIPDGFELPSTNDPDLSVTGWVYAVAEDFPGARPAYWLEVPYNGGPINLPDAAPVVTPPELAAITAATVPFNPEGTGLTATNVQDAIEQAAAGGGGPGAQVPSDWLATTGVARILNKPTLGTASAQPSEAFATAAQGALAATAVQPASLATVATSGAYADLSGRPVLGTAAAEPVGAFATAAQGALAATAVQPAALASVAFSGAYSDLTGAPVLGTAAFVAASSFATSVQGALADTALQPGALSGYLTDAPSNGQTYGRQNGAWVVVSGGGVAGVTQVSTGEGLTGGPITSTGTISLSSDTLGALALAATAVQPGALATVATTGAYEDLTGRPTLGTASTQPTSAFATAAQGATADTAVQPGALATVATSGAYADLSGRPALGTAAAAAATDFATAAQGALAATAVQPGVLAAVALTGDYDTLNGLPVLGTASTQPTGAFATAAQGALAATAVQPDSLAAVATSGAYSSLSGLPTLGTAAAQPTSAFATSAQGTLAGTALQPRAGVIVNSPAGAFTATAATHAGLGVYNRCNGNVTFNSAQAYTAGQVYNLRALGAVTLIGTGVTLTPTAGGTLAMTAGMGVQVVFVTPTTAEVNGLTVAA